MADIEKRVDHKKILLRTHEMRITETHKKSV